MNFFNHHLQNVNETYFEHLKFGAWAAVVLMFLSLVSLIHAVFPFVLAGVPYKLYRYFQTRSKSRIERIYGRQDTSHNSAL